MFKSGLAYFSTEARPADGAPPPAWRRLFHLVAGSSIPVAGIFASEAGMVAGLAVVSAGGLGLDLARFRVSWLNRQFLRWLAPLLKQNEGHRFTGATYLVIGALLAFLFYGPEVAVPAMLFLSLGDPAAALAGRRMPGPRVWGKSPGGTAAFVVIALVVVAALVGSGAIDYHWGLLVGALVAGLVELASVPPDDNLAVPLLAGAAMHFLGA
jgi:dolichol kinase